MRKAFSRQLRFDVPSALNVELDFECRDEIIPILRSLQHIYSCPQLRDACLKLVGQDVNGNSRDDCGREGLDYWEILVLGSARLGCNLERCGPSWAPVNGRKRPRSVGAGFVTTFVC